jgi:hypothetical protein
LSQVQSDPKKKMDIVSSRPKAQTPSIVADRNSSSPSSDNKDSLQPNKRVNALLRPRSAPSTPDFHGRKENHVRVRNEIKLPTPPCPWDNSTHLLDREFLQLQLDNRISSYREADWACLPRPRSSRSKTGGSHECDRKTLSMSYSRCRTSKTSGPVVNIHAHRYGYSGIVDKHINEKEDTGIHKKRWNIATKDKDDEERAKPAQAPNKSAKCLCDEFYSMDRQSKKFSGAIIESRAINQDQYWDSCKKSSSVVSNQV